MAHVIPYQMNLKRVNYVMAGLVQNVTRSGSDKRLYSQLYTFPLPISTKINSDLPYLPKKLNPSDHEPPNKSPL